MDIIRIPAVRVAALIGKDGATKALLEAQCKVALHVSPEGEVELGGEQADIFFAHEVVHAIGRGFEPDYALKLLKEDYQLAVIDLKDYVHSENAIHRIKGRIIGEEGKMKLEIESATDSFLCIYGNTVSIISKLDSIEYAKEALFKLIGGAQHAGVFTYLSGIRRRLMAERLGVQK